ncbi:hypothetical protein Hsw_PA0157 (plasmid) [Hymenobacter swuensis DY53]|uniref:Uncharacterized protein n=1 Tax=Hymenobacter swuensis DY53 TaxID=1227739 RepID=W8F0Z3_9BACT|nr:hypothetical protein Hsw_PA0157 [Hymenobacter swuensis DY53]
MPGRQELSTGRQSTGGSAAHGKAGKRNGAGTTEPAEAKADIFLGNCVKNGTPGPV